MKLFLLRPVKLSESGPWGWDKCYGSVVVAEDETLARCLADEEDSRLRMDMEGHPWLDPSLSICEEILPGTEPRVVIRDEHWA